MDIIKYGLASIPYRQYYNYSDLAILKKKKDKKKQLSLGILYYLSDINIINYVKVHAYHLRDFFLIFQNVSIYSSFLKKYLYNNY